MTPRAVLPITIWCVRVRAPEMDAGPGGPAAQEGRRPWAHRPGSVAVEFVETLAQGRVGLRIERHDEIGNDL